MNPLAAAQEGHQQELTGTQSLINMLKKIFIFSSLILILALAIWVMFFRNNNAPLAEVIRNALPFGSGENSGQPTTDNQQLTTEGGDAFDEFGQPTVNLFRLAVEPVAGFVVLTNVVRYIDRATGHIYDVDLATLKKTKIINKTLPKIYEVYFRADGNAVLLRYLRDDSDTVENLALTLTPPKATSTDGLYEVSATLLRGDIESVAVGAGNALYYSLNDSGAIASSAFNNIALKTLFSSVFTDWRLSGAGSSLIIYTKAGSTAPGYAYTLNQTNGNLTKLLGPLNGLAVMADSSGTHIAYSYNNQNGGAGMEAKNLQTGAVIDIPLATIAEKCVWSGKNRGVIYCGSPVSEIGGNEPDNWYRGVTHFSDRIWRFDTNTEIAQILSEPKASLNMDIDASDLKLSPNEDYLIFTNKRDLSLWALKLEPL